MHTPQKVRNLITIGYAKRVLEPDSREQQRMRRYASVLDELHMIIFTNRADGYAGPRTEGNLFLYPTNTRTRVGSLWAAYRIARRIRKTRSIDDSWVISSQDPFETSLVGRAATGGSLTPHHVQIHGDVFNPNSYRSSWLQRLRVVYGRYVVRRSACIRVVSQRIKASVQRLGVPEAAITVLPIQADLQSFLAVGAARQFDTNTGARAFLYVGRFSPEKDVPLLLKAFAAVAAVHPEVRLTLLGSGPDEPLLRKQIRDLDLANRVTIKSWTDAVSDEMATHDVLCLSSQHEGWAMVLLEAAAAGLPVVTTAVGCAGELIVDGQHGRVVPVGDIAAYTDALQIYVTDPKRWAREGAQAHELAKAVTQPEAAYLADYVESFHCST